MATKIYKTGMIHPEIFEPNDPEKLRVESVINSITSHLTDSDMIGYHFDEYEGHDEKHYEELMSDLPKDAKWHTIYDSCYFPVFDGGSYSVIEVAYSTNRDFYYLALSLGGSLGSSALTEYFKIPITGKWAFSA